MKNAFECSGSSPGKQTRPDFLISSDSAVPSIYLVTPCTKRAHLWVGIHIPEDSLWFGGSLIVEWRFVDALVAGIEGDGLEARRG